MWPFPSRNEPQGTSVTLAEVSTITLEELAEHHDILSNNGSLVVQPKFLAVKDRPDYREYGVSGSTSWGHFSNREYNLQLQGINGLRRWEEMKRNDGMVSGVLTLRKTPVLAARWYIEPASPSKRDKKIAEYVWNCLTKRMTVSWPRFLAESMLHLDYGFYPFEKVFEKEDGELYWRKFASRHPLDCAGFDYDANGGPDGLWVYTNVATAGATKSDRPGQRKIPINKLMVFTHNQEGGALEGTSMLRPLHKHHFIKDVLYKIDSIQKERHGIGIPIIILPPNATSEDKRLAEQMGRNLRTNEKAHVVLPALWDLRMLKLEGQLVDPITSADHHNEMILAAALAQFLSNTGSGNLNTLVDLFMKATRSDAEVVRDTINKWAIEEIVRWQFGKTVDAPTLQVRRIGEIEDQRTLSFALRNLVGSQLLQPDAPLIDAVRKEFDLPMADPSTLILPPAPQGPAGQSVRPDGAPGEPKSPQAGPPRQSKATNMKQSKNSGKANTGQDSSGG